MEMFACDKLLQIWINWYGTFKPVPGIHMGLWASGFKQEKQCFNKGSH